MGHFELIFLQQKNVKVYGVFAYYNHTQCHKQILV